MIKKALAALAVASISTAALAAVTFDPVSGMGFVGKGDVQLAYGWNNAQLQSNAAGVTFKYDSVDSYVVTCEWFTGPASNRRSHQVDHNKSTSVLSQIAYEARKNSQGQITGFNLTGLGATTDTGGAQPHEGDACPGNPGTGAVIIEVNDSGSTGGLYVVYGGTSVLLQ